jgi:benzodiazapine receptor
MLEETHVGGIASKGQLRMSFARWAMVLVPLILLLGFASARAVPAGDESRWYAALAKPEATPPGWAFPVAWAAIYVLMGFALAVVVNARGARGRALAVALFAVGFVLALTWMPLFFGAHLVDASLIVMAGMLLLGIATAIAFGRIRRVAAWLMVPYLVWVSFAGVLTWQIRQLNPDAGALVPAAHTSQML